MTKRLPCPPAPGPLEDYVAQFDALFARLAQRRGLRACLQGLLLPRDRKKTMTALAGVDPSWVPSMRPCRACSGLSRSRHGKGQDCIGLHAACAI
jgi:hypothetical protein